MFSLSKQPCDKKKLFIKITVRTRYLDVCVCVCVCVYIYIDRCHIVNTSSNSFNIIVRQELTVNTMDYQIRALDGMFVVTLSSFFFLIF